MVSNKYFYFLYCNLEIFIYIASVLYSNFFISFFILTFIISSIGGNFYNTIEIK